MAEEQPAVPSTAQSTMLLFILAHSRNSLDSGWEGGTETRKEKVAAEVTEERRDVSGKERDCPVKLPLAAATAHVPPSSVYLGMHLGTGCRVGFR